MRPRLLDLFCCEGGASMGYHRAGFDVYGGDLFKHVNAKGRRVGYSQKRYPFPSVQADAIELIDRLNNGGKVTFNNGETLGLRDFAAYAGSPPCQLYSITNAARGDEYPDLIGPVREGFQASGLPYVIENVEGAPLEDPVMLCGTMFGLSAVDDDRTLLEMWRHRLFESNMPITPPRVRILGDMWTISCRHGMISKQVAGSYGGARRDKHEARYVRKGGYVPAKHVQQQMLGIDWMTEGGMHQSIPPAYTEFIGRQLLAHVGAVAA